MKKLIMFGLVAIAACAVNAASFNWTSAASANGTDGSGNVLTSTADAATFVLCYLGNGASASIDSAVEVMEGTWTIATNKKTGQTSAKVQGTYYGDGAGGFANGNKSVDALEKGALNAVFGKDIPVLSVKEQYGEARAATAALSAAYAAELLAGKAEAKGFNADNAEYILAVSFGLGGSYSAVVIKKA